MCPVGNYPIVFGRESSHYCRKIRVDFEDEGRPESTRSEEHTSELQSHRDLHSFPTRRSSDLDVSCWELSDSFWERIKPLLPKDKSRFRGRGKARKHIGGRPAADKRRVMAGILFVLRTGCQWNAAPREVYGSGKTLHRYFQRWVRAGVFRRMWKAGLGEYDEVHGLKLRWQAADGAITKAPLGGDATGPNPTDRGKMGTKRSLLVEEKGVPIGIEIAGAQRHDT